MSDWPLLTIEEICQRITSGGTPSRKKPEYFANREGHPWVKSAELLDAVVTHTEERISEQGLENSSAKYLPENTVLLAMYGANVGQLGFLKIRATLNQAICGMVANTKACDPQFLFYSLMAHRGRLVQQAHGAAQQNLSAKLIKQFSIPVPPLEIQQRIAAILGAYDDLIEVNRRRVAVLEEMARGLFEEWFVHFRFPGHEDMPIEDNPEGPLPEGWDWGKFSQIAPEFRETLSPSSVDPETPYVGLEHFPRRSTTLIDRGLASDVESTKARFRRGDILFGKIRPYFHKVIWAPFDGIASTDAIIWRPDPRFAAMALQIASSDAFVAHSVQTSNGTKMPRANAKVLAEYPCVMPNANLSQQFEGLVMPLVEHAAILQQMSKRLAASRDLLLPRLISGQLSVEATERELEDAA